LAEVKAPAKAAPETPKPAPRPPEALKVALEAPPSPEALTRLRELRGNYADNAEKSEAILLRIGKLSLALNDPQGARTAYEQAAKVAKDKQGFQQATEGVAKAAALGGDYKTASMQWAVLRESSSEMARNPRILNAQALALAAQGDFSGAGALWNQTEKTATGNERAAALLGQALAAELQGRSDQARAQLKRLVKEFADTPESPLAQKRLADLEKPLAP
jgi:tetratricopeptide (TPR) repeat protein